MPTHDNNLSTRYGEEERRSRLPSLTFCAGVHCLGRLASLARTKDV